MSLLDLELPTDRTLITREAWVGERLADLAEGLLSIEQGWFVHGLILGWLDTPGRTREDERRLGALAEQMQTLISHLEED